MFKKAHAKPFDVGDYWTSRERLATQQEQEWLASKHPDKLERYDHLLTDITGIDVETIELEIRTHYKEQCAWRENENQASDETNNHLILYSSYPRLRFLLEKHRFLILQKPPVENEARKITTAENNPEVKIKNKSTGLTRTLFNVGKKFIDVLDDAWYTLRSILPTSIINLVGSFLLGSVGFITHLGEGYHGAKEAYKAYKNEEVSQRKTKILTNALSFMLAGAGAGMGLTLIAGGAGAFVAGGALAVIPVLIPGFLLTIYSLGLWRKSYIFSRTKEEVLVAEKGLYKQNELLDNLRDEILGLEEKVDAVRNKIQPILEKSEKNSKLSASEGKTLRAYAKVMNELINKEAAYAKIKACVKTKQQQVIHSRTARLRAERGVAFNSIEVTASCFVVVGAILGATALIGASIASFGAVPLAMIITGVVLGVACKVLERLDEKYNFDHTKKIRQMFINAGEKLKKYFNFSPKKSPQQQQKVSEETRPTSVHGCLTKSGFLTLKDVPQPEPAVEPSTNSIASITPPSPTTIPENNSPSSKLNKK